jgi:hypothetical protein
VFSLNDFFNFNILKRDKLLNISHLQHIIGTRGQLSSIRPGASLEHSRKSFTLA